MARIPDEELERLKREVSLTAPPVLQGTGTVDKACISPA
jgi:hypothetical protein